MQNLPPMPYEVPQLFQNQTRWCRVDLIGDDLVPAPDRGARRDLDEAGRLVSKLEYQLIPVITGRRTSASSACWMPDACVQELDLAVAEDAVQDACSAALVQWPAAGVPSSPRAWLVSVARHKALDRLRRDARRVAKEALLLGGATPRGRDGI